MNTVLIVDDISEGIAPKIASGRGVSKPPIPIERQGSMLHILTQTHAHRVAFRVRVVEQHSVGSSDGQLVVMKHRVRISARHWRNINDVEGDGGQIALGMAIKRFVSE